MWPYFAPGQICCLKHGNLYFAKRTSSHLAQTFGSSSIEGDCNIVLPYWRRVWLFPDQPYSQTTEHKRSGFLLRQGFRRALKRSMFGCVVTRESSRLWKTHGIIFSKMDLRRAMTSCLKGEGRRPLSDKAFDAEVPARPQHRYLSDEAQTFEGLGCIQRQSRPHGHCKYHLVWIDLWCRKEHCCWQKFTCSRWVCQPLGSVALWRKGLSTLWPNQIISWKKRTLIGENDIHISAHAISQGLILVTNNLKEFKRVPHLA